MKVLLIGQAPSRSGGHGRAFDGASAQRLARMIGIDADEFLARFQTVNLLRRWPGPGRTGTKGDAFPLVRARRAAQRLEFGDATVVVLMGRAVARAFDVGDRPLFEWFALQGRQAVIVPHPSGANHWWDDAVHAAFAARWWRELAMKTVPNEVIHAHYWHRMCAQIAVHRLRER